MLPIYLSIEGLYSYQQKQEIDFTKLTEAGLFGIFGAVGSGKSSVLEAISFALYGHTERLNSRENRAYNMMNLKSNNVVIDFHFINFEGKKFRYIAQWRRRKKFFETADYTRTAYEWRDGTWIPLEHNDGALATNLSYENFRRTIIIPQGQFKEFLELKGKDRSEMMKEIFQLNQYDLGPKVSHLLSDVNKKIEHLSGALSGFQEVNEDVLQQKTLQFEQVKTELSNQRKSLETIKLQFESMQTAKQNRIDLESKQQELNVLESKNAYIEKIESELAEYELVVEKFKEHISSLSTISTNKNEIVIKIQGFKDNKDAIKNILLRTEERFSVVQGQFEKLEDNKLEIQDIKKFVENIDFQNKKGENESRIENGLKYLNDQKSKEKLLTENISKIEVEIENIKRNKINTEDLISIESWFQREDKILKDIEKERQKVDDLNLELTKFSNKFKELSYSQENWRNEIELVEQSLLKKEKELSELEASLRLKQELSQYIHNLKDGVACPLCGALEHPSPMHTKELTTEFNILNENRESLNKEKSNLEKHKSELLFASSLIIEKSTLLEKLNLSFLELEEQYINHHNTFIWEEFDKNNRADFENRKTELYKIESIIQEKENQLKTLRADLNKTRENIQKSEPKLQELKNEITILQANIVKNITGLMVLKAEDYNQLNRQQLLNKQHEIELKIQQVETEYQQLNIDLMNHKTQYAQIQGKYQEAQEQYTKYQASYTQIHNLINELLVRYNFSDIASIHSVLNKRLNTSDLRKTIQEYHINYATLVSRINELILLTKDDIYSDALYEQLGLSLKEKEQELEQQMRLFGAIKEELDRITIEIEKKKDLLTEYEKVLSRKENLKTLDNMFRSNGFVNFVSSIHLERLCEIANSRFQRLTKNQLSLVINENNEFEVVDFLNNGYRRSAKTLSGGQSFQASLCLALALAENIQSLNKAEKNFFFIDEGFGTQDSESINTVFDTLQYLHQENRVVGIISHVEELKERMPRALTIIKDEDKGSQIKIN